MPAECAPRSARTGVDLVPWDRAAMCFVGSWVFIAFVAVHDAYLVVLCRDVILDVEQNPIGRYLLRQDDGGVGLFLTVKAAGTAGVCTLLLSLYHYCRRMALAVAGASAFLTPIATPANLMVMEPAGYRFGDYWRLGLPLVLFFLAVAVLYVPLVWPF